MPSLFTAIHLVISARIANSRPSNAPLPGSGKFSSRLPFRLTISTSMSIGDAGVPAGLVEIVADAEPLVADPQVLAQLGVELLALVPFVNRVALDVHLAGVQATAAFPSPPPRSPPRKPAAAAGAVPDGCWPEWRSPTAPRCAPRPRRCPGCPRESRQASAPSRVANPTL